jgi:O-antigen ligase
LVVPVEQLLSIRGGRGAAAAVTFFGLVVFAAAVYLQVTLWLIVVVGVLGAAFVIMRKPLWGLALGAAMMPLEAVGRVVPDNPDWTYAKVVLFSTIALALVNALVTRHEWVAPRYVWALGVFWAIALVASVVYRGATFVGAAGLVALAGQILFVILLYNFARSERDLDIVIGALVLGSVSVAVIGVLDVAFKRSFFNTVAQQYYGDVSTGSFRITSTFYDPNALGRYLVFAFFITLGALALPVFRKFALPMTALLAVQLFCLVNSYSRGAVVAWLAGLALYLLWGAPRRMRWIGGTTILTGVLVGWWTSPSVFGAIGERFQDVGGGPVAWGGRLEILRWGFRALADSPLIGFGPDNVPDAIGRYGFAPWAAHNLYMDIALATGVIGFAFLAYFVVYHVSVLFRSRTAQPYARMLLVAFFAVLVVGLSLHGLKTNELWLSIALLAPLARLRLSQSVHG